MENLSDCEDSSSVLYSAELFNTSFTTVESQITLIKANNVTILYGYIESG